jgi:predicted MPP superfamily phosphohydrolase
MKRIGPLGVVLALASLAVGLALIVALHRWLVRRLTPCARHPRLTFAALIAPMLLGPASRWVALAGFDERLYWVEACGQLWAVSLLSSVPGIFAWEWLTARRAKRPLHESLASPSRREALVGGAFVGVSAASVAWGVRSRFDAEVVEVPIRLSRLPRALDGFSIVQVSDIHIGAFLGEAQLRDADARIAALRPDLVVMTGDLVHVQPSYLPLAMDWLRRLASRARYGQLSILGNHEYYTGRAAVLDAFARAELDLLVNRSKRIAPGLVVSGVDDLWGERSGHGPKLRPTLEGTAADDAKILLCHQPNYHPIAAAQGFDLQLSGHTHGGQIAPFGPIVAKAMFGAYKGLYRIGSSSLYVNRGFGTSGPPTRVAVRPEITKIILVAG